LDNKPPAKITPYDQSTDTKKGQVRKMFDKIAPYYDFLNHLLSLGVDIRWRKKAIKTLRSTQPNSILDVATGTGDLAFEAQRQFPNAAITGLDLAPQMLVLARKKQAAKQQKEALETEITFLEGDSETLPFEDNAFEAVTAGFGVRNFENLEIGLNEMYRVIKPGGQLVILEFSKPRYFPFKQIYNGYFKYVLPQVGRLTSKDPKAYRYLYESVQVFPDYDSFTDILQKIGFVSCQYRPLSLGICCIYYGLKP
jgi:demethylmenaquinone methyltransferase / 2-methoxy-6-polyprenyl-1,4-benzoquinol methylase